MAMERVATTNSGVDSRCEVTKEDLSGRERLFSNVLWGWISYFIVFAIGFIMPRLIDRRLGQVELGIWDFSWSLVSYLSYSNLGVGSAVNRYVARFRATQDVAALRCAVSSVAVVQVLISLFIVFGTATLSLLLPVFFSEKFGTHLEQAQWVVILLGLSIAFGQALNAFRGVISGCHRWDLHNGLNLLSRATTFIGMLVVVVSGMGLKALAGAYLGGIVLAETTRAVVAFRVCPELKVRLSYASWRQTKEMIFFGWKTVVSTLSPLVVVQTVSVVVTGVIGPAMLAVLARSVALVRHMSTFVNRFAFVTTTTAGALQAGKDERELKHFFLESCKLGMAISLPMVIVLIILGRNILLLWMGPRYVTTYALELLALGYLLPVSQSPALRILVGLDKHGRIGWISFTTALATLGLGIVVLNSTGWSLTRAAFLIGIPLTLGNGMLIPLYACRVMGVPFSRYIYKSFAGPLLCNAPLSIILILSRTIFSQAPILSVFVGLIVGGSVTAILYLFFVLPRSCREKISKSIFMPSIHSKTL